MIAGCLNKRGHHFKIAAICILTAGMLVAFLSTGLGSEVALAIAQ